MRLVRALRRIVGALCFAAAGYWLVSAWLVASRRSTPLYGEAVGAHGEAYRLRIRPLSAAELEAARELERRAFASAWRDVQ